MVNEFLKPSINEQPVNHPDEDIVHQRREYEKGLKEEVIKQDGGLLGRIGKKLSGKPITDSNELMLADAIGEDIERGLNSNDLDVRQQAALRKLGYQGGKLKYYEFFTETFSRILVRNISGILDGQKISITKVSGQEYEGEFGGRKLDNGEAKLLFKKLVSIPIQRTLEGYEGYL